MIHFVSGLPRAGSTLLCNILAQNPKFHATSTSGILEVLFNIRNTWSQLDEFKASPNDEGLRRVMRAAINAYHEGHEDKVVFDKSRGWNSHIELVEEILERQVKILVPVRDIREVVASMEVLWRKNAPYRQFHLEKNKFFQWQSQKGRVEAFVDASQPIGIAYNRIKDAVHRGFADRMLFVRFEDLTSNPIRTLDEIYTFLGEEPFKHDFDHVKQVIWENDEIHYMKGLHDIRPKVEPVPSKWEKVLGKEFGFLKDQNFWDK